MAKLIATFLPCLLAANGAAAAVTGQFSVDSNVPTNGAPNVHLSLSVPEDETEQKSYGVIIYYKGPWRLHRSGSEWSPQRIAGGKTWIEPNDAYGFHTVTLPCFLCTGGGSEYEQPPQPTPFTNEIHLTVPFENYAWAEGGVTAEVWECMPPTNPIVPGGFSLAYRKTIKVQPSHSHRIFFHHGHDTGWVRDTGWDDFKLDLKIIAVSKWGFEIVDDGMLKTQFCKKLAKKLLRLLKKRLRDPVANTGYLILTLDFDWERRTKSKAYTLICCHNGEYDLVRDWDPDGNEYWVPEVWGPYEATLREERIHMTAKVAEILVTTEYIDLGYTVEETTDGRTLWGDYHSYCLGEFFPWPQHELPTEWWSSHEPNYQWIGPRLDGHDWRCGENPQHTPVYTMDPAGWDPFPPPELIQ